MVFQPSSLGDFRAATFDTIIDVRAPSEFAEDHVPGAINLPVLSDEERARVGTIYVQDSPFKARKIGAALVAANAARHLEGPLAEKDGAWQPLVYCWRGGQRSGSFASILSQIGWRVETLGGGYQTYRRMVVEALYDKAFPTRVILLDGNTGTAKTEVLARLARADVQVIDLEGLANHRGSALGGQGDQPSQKAFETSLAQSVAELDPTRAVVIEAESSRVGQINLPPRLFEAMRAAPRLEINAPIEARAAYLCEAYADLLEDPAVLLERLSRLVRLQGRERVDTWSDMARAGEFEALAAALIEHHYDPRYAKGRARRGAETLAIEVETLDSDGIDAIVAQVIAEISS